jgi:hypothetical protein
LKAGKDEAGGTGPLLIVAIAKCYDWTTGVITKSHLPILAYVIMHDALFVGI